MVRSFRLILNEKTGAMTFRKIFQSLMKKIRSSPRKNFPIAEKYFEKYRRNAGSGIGKKIDQIRPGLRPMHGLQSWDPSRSGREIPQVVRAARGGKPIRPRIGPRLLISIESATPSRGKTALCFQDTGIGDPDCDEMPAKSPNLSGSGFLPMDDLSYGQGNAPARKRCPGNSL